MTYRFNLKRNDMFLMMVRHSQSKIEYYSKLKMKELYPDGGYEIIGEIGNFKRKYTGLDMIVTDTGESIPIFPRGSFMKPFEWIAGYAAVGENTYVAVIKGVIPRFV